MLAMHYLVGLTKKKNKKNNTNASVFGSTGNKTAKASAHQIEQHQLQEAENYLMSKDG